ncbi:hypothetical protein Glove_180g104 [Diversispora epigaea]|uniref:Uncharacterized protein n=1 Tax=Diversispora epigaea TaxID=1348612 RepID=A0A397IN51_9GLOM|nr:hypothetical protein Glove_180g104 [Diversispora epigaea]
MIGFGDGFQTCIESIKSATDVANKYLHIKNSNTKTRLSDIHVFGLNSQELEREREKKYQSRFLKPFNMLGNTMKIKRVRKFGELISDSFNNVVKSSFHPDDNFALQEIHFKVQDKNIQVNFENRDLEKENKKNEAFLKVIDQGPIARDSYRSLTALLPELPRENAIYTVKKNINEEMANKIPISILNISNFSSFNLINENLNINNSEVEEEVLKYVGKAGYRRVTDILIYIIPGLVKRKILNNSIINLRISGDRRNVRRKLKHVMITFTILDDTLNLQKSDYHFTVILYLGNENYETLQKVMEPMISELNDLSIHGLKDLTGKVWTIILYFSSDWKFLAIILGFNSANSKYFCPWCLCTKKDIGNINKTWTIEKNIDQIKTAFLNNEKPPPGHIKPPLLSMISLDHYIPDELHIMLRIWDRLWGLVIQELKAQNQFNNLTRTKIINEMRRISVTFYFWQEQGTQNWKFTSLMGGDKEIVLKDFNFEIIFDKERACLINKLWWDFYQLYKNIKLKETNSIQFAN